MKKIYPACYPPSVDKYFVSVLERSLIDSSRRGVEKHKGYGAARPARIHRDRTISRLAAQGLQIVGRQVVRQYRNKHIPELGAIHIKWPFQPLIAATTKRRGLRLFKWAIDGKIYTYNPGE